MRHQGGAAALCRAALLICLSAAGAPAAPCPPGGVNIRDFGAVGDGASHPVGAAGLAALPPAQAAGLTRGDEADAVALQRALFAASASAARTVCLSDGTYVIDRALPAGWAAAERAALADRLFLPASRLDGAALWYDAMDGVTLVATGAAVMTSHRDMVPIWAVAPQATQGGIVMSGLSFRNLGLAFAGDPGGARIGPLTLDSLSFLGGPGHQLQLLRTRDSTVTGSFFRRNREQRGRGLAVWKSHRVTVEDNRFEGYITTAINVSGTQRDDIGNLFGPFNLDERSHDVTIRNNVLNRDPAAVYQDHAIYVWGADGVVIDGNEIGGWESSRFGTDGSRYSGAIKARNGENYIITGNTIRDTGILLYAYDSDYFPRYLKNVLVADNIVSVHNGRFDYCQYKGITYWKNFDPDPAQVYEESIVIRGNTVKGGCIQINGNRANLGAVSLIGNTATEYRFHLPNIGWRGLEDSTAAGVFATAHGNR